MDSKWGYRMTQKASADLDDIVAVSYTHLVFVRFAGARWKKVWLHVGTVRIWKNVRLSE